MQKQKVLGTKFVFKSNKKLGGEMKGEGREERRDEWNILFGQFKKLMYYIGRNVFF